MALVGRAELVRRAEALGHTDLRLYRSQSGRRWICQCSCGWGSFGGGQPTVTRATFEEGVRTLQDHLWRALEEDRKRRVANGGATRRSIPHDVGLA